MKILSKWPIPWYLELALIVSMLLMLGSRGESVIGNTLGWMGFVMFLVAIAVTVIRDASRTWSILQSLSEQELLVLKASVFRYTSSLAVVLGLGMYLFVSLSLRDADIVLKGVSMAAITFLLIEAAKRLLLAMFAKIRLKEKFQ